MASLRLRDRDAIITSEGLIFRVFGYSHPAYAYVCDVEYAPSQIFESKNSKAFRNCGEHIFFKFFGDEGIKFVRDKYPKYFVFHEMLCNDVVGVRVSDITRVSIPNERLMNLVGAEPADELVAALQSLLAFVTNVSCLTIDDFGVFGSLLHGFYHPRFSDMDFTVYGRRNMDKLREALFEVYKSNEAVLRNEFDDDVSVRGKPWRFKNYGTKEYLWHQRRKLIYALFKDGLSGRTIKTEFEPVKSWREIKSEYDAETKILQRGWVRMTAKIVDDQDAPFIPSIYVVEPLNVFMGVKEAIEARRIVSYMEEFRLQAFRDEVVYVEGTLEEVKTVNGSFYQVALSYCPRYYEQVLKVLS